MAALNENAITRLVTVSGVDMNSGTAQTLYTVPTGKSCLPIFIIAREASTSLTTVSFSIGFNSASFNNIIANATHTELTGATLYTVLSVKTGATRGIAGDVLKLLCNTLQGGAATATFDVLGILY